MKKKGSLIWRKIFSLELNGILSWKRREKRREKQRNCAFDLYISVLKFQYLFFFIKFALKISNGIFCEDEFRVYRGCIITIENKIGGIKRGFTTDSLCQLFN